MSNLAADWREGLATAPRAFIAAASAGESQARILLHCPLPPAGLELPPEKLFEPFASGRPGGLGLGLYQARTCLREAGGELFAKVAGPELQFALHIPQKCEKVGNIPQSHAGV